MRALFLAAAALACAMPAGAEPPLRTDDARVTEPGGCQVEGYATRQRGGAREQALEFGCGVNKWIEVSLGRASGRTTLIQAKVLPMSLDQGPYGFGFTAGVARTDPFFNLIGGFKTLKERAAVHLNLGAERDGRADLTRATAGIAGEYTIDKSLQLVAEFSGRRGEKPAPLAGIRLYLLPEHLHLTVAGGKRSATLGFHWDF